jgi:tetratricopeptide (TPR) repeat protein
LPELVEADFGGGKRAFLFFESKEKGVAVPVDAEQLAAQLQFKQIPVCILNACQSAKQEGSARETSLGRVLIGKGIQVVLAMRYSVSVSAAKLLMKMLYRQLYAGQTIERAIGQARQELYRNKDRHAAYNHVIQLEDWLLPVVYQNGRPQLHLRPPTPQELEQLAQHGAVPPEARQTLEYGFFGRDLDILKIEKNLLVRSNLLLLQGMGGAGKTTLLKYLADWWLRTGFVENVFYFGYDLKAHSLNEILYYIAKRIYDRFKFATFTALLPEVQADEIVRELRTKRYALILDNTESITGEKLSIPNTLPPAERTALKAFLAQLKGGLSVVLIGSRSDEEWLKPGTFGNNRYLLQGLNWESATTFAHEILQENGLAIKAVANGPHFERLMKLLAGYPLALKAILPNLKRKTAKVILDDLQAGVGDLDKGNAQEKTESIIKCIEYAYSNLSEDAQKLLLCLAPFQSAVTVLPDIIENYFHELRKEEPFKDYPFSKLDQVIQEAVRNGFMQEVSPESGQPIMVLQPAFTFFLRNKLQAENVLLRESLETSFINQYRHLGSLLVELLYSNDVESQKRGEWLTNLEYDNFYQALIILLNRHENVGSVYKVIAGYLKKQNRHNERLQIAEMVHKKTKQYSLDLLSKEIIYDLVDIENTLGSAYYFLNQRTKAQQTWEELLALYETNSFIDHEVELQSLRGLAWNNLGSIAQEHKDFKSAEDYYQKALSIYDQCQDVYNQGQTYNNLGSAYYEQKDFLRAEVCYSNPKWVV